MVYFNSETKEILEKKLRKATTFVSVVCGVSLVLFVMILFRATYQKSTWAIVTDSIILSLAGIVTIFVLTTVILPSKKMLTLTNKVLTQNASSISGVVEQLEYHVTLDKYICGDVVKLVGQVRRYYCILLRNMETPQVGDHISIRAVDGYIVEWEVQDD